MEFRKYSHVLFSLLVLQSIVPTEIAAAAPQVKIINASKQAIVLVLLRTKSGTKHQELYGEKTDIKARILLAGKDFYWNNFPQKIGTYDRVLWVVPLKFADVQALGTALYDGNKKNQPLVKAFEVGSAKTITITTDDKGKLNASTTGKLTEGAKAILKAAKGAFDEEEQLKQEIQSGGYTINELLSGAIGKSLEDTAKKFVNKIDEGIKQSVKSIKHSYNVRNNPVDWPVNATMTFDEVVDILGLDSQQKLQLKKYKDLKDPYRKALKESIRASMGKSTKEGRYKAFAQLLEYTKATGE